MPKSVERCVQHVKGKGKVRNPWAVCVAAFKRKHGRAPKMHHRKR